MCTLHKSAKGFIYREKIGITITGILHYFIQVIPPSEWIPRRDGYEDLNITIPAPITQVVSGCQGLYQQYNIQKKSLTTKEFEKLANSERYLFLCVLLFF